jgi:uncharacterized metal-binding protein YceD (DUF177 family)
MKIPFNSIGSQTTAVTHTLKDEDFEVTLEGSLKKKGYGAAELDASFSGVITLDCDGCGEQYSYKLEEKVTLKLTDSPYKAGEGNGADQDYDIIEFIDGIIDFDEIIISEVNTIKYDFHKCEKCQ